MKPDGRITRRRPIASFIAVGILYTLAAVMLAGGGWALWQDRIDRDSSGFVTIGSSDLRTNSYALTSKLHGDGPRWLYGSAVFGDIRFRGTSQSARPIFIGIARTSDVDRYVAHTGYATIQGLATGDVTTHSGSAQSTPPSQTSIWNKSTQGIGEQTLVWHPRDGAWSVVIMNADASAGVAVHGDVSAKFPPLPWVAAGLLGLGAVLALIATWLLVRALRAQGTGRRSDIDLSGKPNSTEEAEQERPDANEPVASPPA